MEEMDVLDIGGGFSMTAANEQNNFDKIAPKIHRELNKMRVLYPNITLIGEPGRLIS